MRLPEEKLRPEPAAEAQRPLHISPSGITNVKFPVLPGIPSATASIIGTGTAELNGPSTGIIMAVIEREQEIEARQALIMASRNTI